MGAGVQPARVNLASMEPVLAELVPRIELTLGVSSAARAWFAERPITHQLAASSIRRLSGGE